MNEQQQWNSIVERIGSDKVKERTQAASQFRAFLSSPRLFNALVASGHHWLETLQALFHLVITERNAYKSKGATTSLKRLEDATNLVVWLVDKIHHVIPRKALKATYSHLTQMIARDGALQPYALAYLRALRSLLSHTPHLEHLDEKLWIDIVALCFAAVLGDKIRIGDELVEEAPREQRHGGRAVVEDDEEWEAPAVRVTANQEEIELVACIETAFRSTTAPFLAHGTVILRKFLRFFRRFNKETTAHLPAITALNRVFSHIELNDQQTMRELGSQLWPSLLEVWSTKNPQLKEQLVMALRFLFPFVVAEGQTDGSIETKIKPLWSKVLMEPTIRWRDTFELSLDSLRFGTDGLSGGGEESESKAFHGKTFRMGSRFDAKQAMAWSMLELGADCLERMYSLAEGAYAVEASQPEGSGRNTRRKVSLISLIHLR
jgi:ataxia telangiectasia mutated family protein